MEIMVCRIIVLLCLNAYSHSSPISNETCGAGSIRPENSAVKICSPSLDTLSKCQRSNTDCSLSTLA